MVNLSIEHLLKLNIINSQNRINLLCYIFINRMEIIMIITDIVQNKRFKNYYDIYIDDEYLFFITKKELKFLKLESGNPITEEELSNIYRDYIYSRAKSRAFRLLQRKDMTKVEMIQKLKDTGYNKHVIDTILSFLEEYNFINDREYVRKYFEYNKTKKSVKKISIELNRKGINKELVTEYIDKIEVCEENVAYDLLYRRYGKIDNIDDKIKNRMTGYLMRKGYNYSIVNKVIRQLINDKN